MSVKEDRIDPYGNAKLFEMFPHQASGKEIDQEVKNPKCTVSTIFFGDRDLLDPTSLIKFKDYGYQKIQHDIHYSDMKTFSINN